jgi:hypothetical protein
MVTKRLKENYLVRFAFEIPAYSAQHYFNGSSGLRPQYNCGSDRQGYSTNMKSTQCKSHGHGTGLNYYGDHKTKVNR